MTQVRFWPLRDSSINTLLSYHLLFNLYLRPVLVFDHIEVMCTMYEGSQIANRGHQWSCERTCGSISVGIVAIVQKHCKEMLQCCSWLYSVCKNMKLLSLSRALTETEKPDVHIHPHFCFPPAGNLSWDLLAKAQATRHGIPFVHLLFTDINPSFTPNLILFPLPPLTHLSLSWKLNHLHN